MDAIIDFEKLFHRSKERIRILGEVFTPETYVEEMLDILTKDRKNIWSDENFVFFEPCCGHGNFVTAIYKRRLEAIYRKAVTNKTLNPAFYAVANAANTIWAIDLDRKNIENCRTRVLAITIEFILEKEKTKSLRSLLKSNKEFFSHFLSTLSWQITENETLSSLSDEKSAKLRSRETRIGHKWFLYNGHRKLNFEISWVEHFKACELKRVKPIEFERANKFIDAILAGRIKGYEEFESAKFLLNLVGGATLKQNDSAVGV